MQIVYAQHNVNIILTRKHFITAMETLLLTREAFPSGLCQHVHVSLENLCSAYFGSICSTGIGLFRRAYVRYTDGLVQFIHTDGRKNAMNHIKTVGDALAALQKVAKHAPEKAETRIAFSDGSPLALIFSDDDELKKEAHPEKFVQVRIFRSDGRQLSRGRVG